MFAWNVLWISVWSISFIMSVSFIVSLFSFCFDDLCHGKSGALKSPTINVCHSLDCLSFSNVSFMDMGVLAFGT